MSSDYKNFYVEDGGRRYRVAFYLTLNKVMIVARQAPVKHGRESAIRIDGKRAAPIIAKARVALADWRAAQKGETS